MRVGFAGTPAFAARALQALLDARFVIPLVLTQPDRPAGRGLKLLPSPVKQLALAHALPLAQPRSLKLDGRWPDDAQAARAALDAARLDVLVVAAYGLILPPWTLALPRRGCLNIHASLLPRWRGAAPIQRAIEAGDRETGITIMQMDAGLDTGAMLQVERVPIAPDATAGALTEVLAEVGARALVQTLHSLDGRVAQAQPADGVTYAHKIDKAQAAIDWRAPAAELERRLRAFDPAPGCHAEIDGEPLKLWRAKVSDGFGGTPGELRGLGERALVACGDGRALELIEVQRPGARRQSGSSWLAARR